MDTIYKKIMAMEASLFNNQINGHNTLHGIVV